MLKLFKKCIWKLFVIIDSKLKFPELKKGETGIQVGFDMDFALTSDVFSMYRKVKPHGNVLAIDADSYNINVAKEYIKGKNWNISFCHSAVFSEKGVVELNLGKRASWNRLDKLPKVTHIPLTEKKIKVPMDTLDSIVKNQNIPLDKISHINLTINGSEYYALLGMKEILSKAKNICLTIIAGHYSATGFINGENDYKLILNLLHEYGFKTKFKRIHQLFWWGFVVKLLLNRKWVYGKKNSGVIMAAKGNKKIKWYQSFS